MIFLFYYLLRVTCLHICLLRVGGGSVSLY